MQNKSAIQRLINELKDEINETCLTQEIRNRNKGAIDYLSLTFRNYDKKWIQTQISHISGLMGRKEMEKEKEFLQWGKEALQWVLT